MERSSQGDVVHSIHRRGKECVSRRSESTRTETQCRVVSPSLSGSRDLPSLGNSARGSVRHSQEPQTTPILLPVPGPSGVESGRIRRPWDSMELYALSPFSLIRRTINNFQDNRNARMVFVAPLWHQREWFPDLLTLLADLPRELPTWSRLLKQTQGETFHGSVGF